MKFKEIGLIAAGAAATLAVIASVSLLGSAPKARAQEWTSSPAPAPGGASMVVVYGSSASSPQNGMIVMHDSVNRKVTVVGVLVSYLSTNTFVTVSSNASFTY